MLSICYYTIPGKAKRKGIVVFKVTWRYHTGTRTLTVPGVLLVFEHRSTALKKLSKQRALSPLFPNQRENGVYT